MGFKWFKRGMIYTSLIVILLLAGQIILLAIQSETPNFNKKIDTLLELIPAGSDEVIILQNLKDQSESFLKHPLVKEFKQLKLSEELVYSKESKLAIEIVKSFEKYSGLSFDEDMFFRFFGKESALAWKNKDFYLVTKVDRLTMFLKQVAKTLSQYKVIQKEIQTTEYQNINIETVSFRGKEHHLTFIQDYMFISTDINKVKNIIDKAKGKDFESFENKENLKNHLTQNKINTPIVLYKKVKKSNEDISLGSDRLNEYFQEKIWTVQLNEKKIQAQYHFYYSDLNKKYPMSKIVADSARKESKIVEGFPNATAFYVKSDRISHNEFYNWLTKSWLGRDGLLDTFNTTFDEVEKFYKVSIREMIKNELGNEVAVLMTGVGYQGFNPFPKMAYIVKTSKYAKPMEKMRKIFKYALGTSSFKSKDIEGVPVVYYPSTKRIGYYYYYYRKKDTTSEYKEFSPSFAFVNGYMVVTFNENTMKAIINYFKNSKGLKENQEHKDFWANHKKDYVVDYYVNPGRAQKLAKVYLEYLYKNEESVFFHKDAEKRLTPMMNLFSKVKSIGGGLNFLKDRIEGDIIINLK